MPAHIRKKRTAAVKSTMEPAPKIGWWHTEVGASEKTFILEAFDRRHISMGPVTREFEKRLSETLQMPYVLLTPSGTAALAMAFLALGVGPDSEVIVPDLTWIATPNAAAILGAKVVLVDCQKNLPLLDAEEVKRKITPRTKAIVIVHANGRHGPVDALLEVARKSNIALIEDTCKALASRSPHGYMGTLGDISCFSLGMVSLVSAGYGGFVATKNAALYEKMLAIRNQGVPSRGPERYVTLGFNFKVSDLLSSMGLAQLARLPEKIKHVRRVYDAYCEGLSGHPFIDIIPVSSGSGEIPLCMEARSAHREELIAYMADNNVEVLRFHRPHHEAAYLQNGGRFPQATKLGDEAFILPCGPAQPLENVWRCVTLLKEWRPSRRPSIQ